MPVIASGMGGQPDMLMMGLSVMMSEIGTASSDAKSAAAKST